MFILVVVVYLVLSVVIVVCKRIITRRIQMAAEICDAPFVLYACTKGIGAPYVYFHFIAPRFYGMPFHYCLHIHTHTKRKYKKSKPRTLITSFTEYSQHYLMPMFTRVHKHKVIKKPEIESETQRIYLNDCFPTISALV